MNTLGRMNGGITSRAGRIRRLDATSVRSELRKRSAYPTLRGAVDVFTAMLMIGVSLVLLDGNGFDSGFAVAIACLVAAALSVFANRMLHMLVDIPDLCMQHEPERWKRSGRPS